MVVFATFVEDGDIVCVFLGLLHITDGKKDAALIFDTLLTSLKEWRLDTDKCVAFGSDGAATMLGGRTGVAARLKEKVSPFKVIIIKMRQNHNFETWKIEGECFQESIIIPLNSTWSHSHLRQR